jgi:hypothetical protein
MIILLSSHNPNKLLLPQVLAVQELTFWSNWAVSSLEHLCSFGFYCYSSKCSDGVILTYSWIQLKWDLTLHRTRTWIWPECCVLIAFFKARNQKNSFCSWIHSFATAMFAGWIWLFWMVGQLQSYIAQLPAEILDTNKALTDPVLHCSELSVFTGSSAEYCLLI